MNQTYRPCPVCRTQLTKRDTPEKMKVEVPTWYTYECMNCGSIVFIQPYANIKQVAKG